MYALFKVQDGYCSLNEQLLNIFFYLHCSVCTPWLICCTLFKAFSQYRIINFLGSFPSAVIVIVSGCFTDMK